jgi:hypothetical protein
MGMAAGAAALAVPWLIGSPVAHADPGDPFCKNYSHTPNGYIADMHRCGFASLKSDDALLATGQRICWQMRSLHAHGYCALPARQIAAAIWRMLASGDTMSA